MGVARQRATAKMEKTRKKKYTGMAGVHVRIYTIYIYPRHQALRKILPDTAVPDIQDDLRHKTDKNEKKTPRNLSYREQRKTEDENETNTRNHGEWRTRTRMMLASLGVNLEYCCCTVLYTYFQV